MRKRGGNRELILEEGRTVYQAVSRTADWQSDGIGSAVGFASPLYLQPSEKMID